jgi:phage shock protein B
MGWSGHFTGVLIVAIVVLGPMWLHYHYRARGSDDHGTGDLRKKLDELTDLAVRMQTRIEALERLLEVNSAKGRQEP